MTPVEDSLLLLAIVRRHLRTLRLGLDSTYPAEDWGFTAQQAVEKLLKARIVLANRQVPRVHDLADLALLAGEEVAAELLSLQVFAVEARYEAGPFPLPADRSSLLSSIELLAQRLEQSIEEC
jgi:HEPN domain-containing protein